MSHQPSRVSVLRNAMRNKGIDVLFVRNLSNIAWITGFEKVFDAEQAHAVLVSPSDIVIHSDSRYSEALKREAHNTNIRVDDRRVSHAQVLFEYAYKLYCDSDSEVSLSDLHTATRVVRIGIEDSLTLSEFHALEKTFNELQLASAERDNLVKFDGDIETKGSTKIDTFVESQNSGDINSCEKPSFDSKFFEFIELSAFVEGLREIKDEEELRCMKTAQAITDRAFERILRFMKVGMTERQVQLQLDSYMFEEGAEGLAFDTIVATGAHASSPHAIPGETQLRMGDAVVMDFGAKYGGYCSDMTRTVFMGEPSQELKHAWQTLQKTNEACESSIKAGAVASEIHQLAEDILADAGYLNKMGHSLGHSVGLDIHETPSLSPSNSRALHEGNVVTVEPGIYIPGSFGMRLEDFGVVTEQGFDVFTKSSHKMFIIEKLN